MQWFLTLSLIKKILLVVFVLGIGWFTVSRIVGANKQQPQYQTAQVTKGSIISTVSESGNVAASNQVAVPSVANGVIEELSIKNGDEVGIGQNLFKVKATATPQEQAAAYASYLGAQNGLNAAQAKLNSLQAALFKANQAFLTDRGVVSPSDQQKADPVYIQENANWLQAEADYKNQTGVIAQAQAALTSASFAYQVTQDAIVTAPIAGTVANLSATVGSSVLSSSTNGTTTNSSPVLVLGNFARLWIKASVNEVDIPKLHRGQKATITLDAFPDKTFVGTVTSVDTIGTSSSGVVTFNVFIAFVSPPSDIQPEMTASIVIQVDRRDDVLTVPTSAVQTTNGETIVRVMKHGNVTQTPVVVGIASDTDTEITSGLSEGDTVVTSVVTQTSTNSQSSSPFSGLGGRGFGGGGFGGGGRGGR